MICLLQTKLRQRKKRSWLFSLELQEQLNTLILPVLALFDAAAAEEKTAAAAPIITYIFTVRTFRPSKY